MGEHRTPAGIEELRVLQDQNAGNDRIHGAAVGLQDLPTRLKGFCQDAPIGRFRPGIELAALDHASPPVNGEGIADSCFGLGRNFRLTAGGHDKRSKGEDQHGSQ